MNKALSYTNVNEFIGTAIQRTVGEKSFTGDSYFKRDLGFSSIDLIDFFFELEKLIGEKINVRQLLLTLGSHHRSGDDLKVQELARHLCPAEPKQ